MARGCDEALSFDEDPVPKPHTLLIFTAVELMLPQEGVLSQRRVRLVFKQRHRNRVQSA